jgi:hypothetical protein
VRILAGGIKDPTMFFIGLKEGDRLMNLILGRLSKDWIFFNRILG